MQEIARVQNGTFGVMQKETESLKHSMDRLTGTLTRFCVE
ncbi:MAG: hypothetical protein BSOLF_0465 [Candidatus Carbobacillus altaicus]|uniref:Uncharacterized protein n=1 Tax=Candidatus Carbonibacillus altaicus TaxID=2163959 RepID=A0A2R6Y5K4_9BACL|nr:MAG: hypothetical protein BSOLF_0465 [Candidatus Carbobacillus altaicus]